MVRSCRSPIGTPIGEHAVDFIIDMASRHRGELVLTSIGPEPNVVLALQPRLAGWLREITVMGARREQAILRLQARMRPRGGLGRIQLRRADPHGRTHCHTAYRVQPDRYRPHEGLPTERSVGHSGPDSILSCAPTRTARPRRGAHAWRMRGRALCRCDATVCL